MKKPLFLFLALFLLLFPFYAVGCGQKVKLTNEELLEKVTSASASLNTCQFNLSQTIHLSGQGKEQKIDRTTNYNIAGVVDTANKKLRLRMTIKLPKETRPQGMPETLEMERYCLGDTFYTHGNVPGMPAQWLKSKAPAGYWESQNPAQEQIELLKASEFKVAGREAIGVLQCWVVEIKPNLKKLQELTGGSPLSQAEAEKFEKSIKSATAKQWYAEGSFFLVKGKVELTLVTSSKELNLPGEEYNVTTDVALVFDASHFNEPVEIELPAGAEKAIEMETPQPGQK